MKGKVIVAELRESKKGKSYNKLLVQIGDTVVGYIFCFDENRVFAPGEAVEFTVGTDYQNNLRLEVR